MASNKHVCPIENCGKEFSKPSRLTIHVRSHTGERPFICPYEDCFKSYARQQHLKRHEEVSHNSKGVSSDSEETSKPQCSCTIDGCEASFPSKHSLNRHINRIHLKNVYKCPAVGCNEEFKKHQHLRTHYAVHQEENPYRCPIAECGKSFPFPNKLKRHLKMHDGYRCEQEGCEAIFDKWTLLLKHRVVHHSEYKCMICGKCFAQKQWLKEHNLVHSEERPVFICSYPDCQREYLSQRNLNAHIKSYHDKQRFECQEPGCGRTFATKQKLQQHLKLHDPDRPLKPPVKKKKKPLAQKLTGVKAMVTEDRGESEDDLLTPVDLHNSFDIAELQLTSGCHSNSGIKNSTSMTSKDYLNGTFSKENMNSLSCSIGAVLKEKEQGGDNVVASLCLMDTEQSKIVRSAELNSAEKNI